MFKKKRTLLNKLKKQAAKDSERFDANPQTGELTCDELLEQVRNRQGAAWVQMKNRATVSPGQAGDGFWERAVSSQRQSLRRA